MISTPGGLCVPKWRVFVELPGNFLKAYFSAAGISPGGHTVS